MQRLSEKKVLSRIPFIMITSERAAQYEKQGYKYHKTIKNFFVENYEFPVIDNGIILKDMIRLIKNL